MNICWETQIKWLKHFKNRFIFFSFKPKGKHKSKKKKKVGTWAFYLKWFGSLFPQSVWEDYVILESCENVVYCTTENITDILKNNKSEIQH